MSDTIELTINNPLTDEEWDMLNDVDFDKTDRIWFDTQHGKHVEFAKVIRCKDCKYWDDHWAGLNVTKCKAFDWRSKPDDFCSFAERKDDA